MNLHKKWVFRIGLLFFLFILSPRGCWRITAVPIRTASQRWPPLLRLRQGLEP